MGEIESSGQPAADAAEFVAIVAATVRRGNRRLCRPNLSRAATWDRRLREAVRLGGMVSRAVGVPVTLEILPDGSLLFGEG